MVRFRRRIRALQERSKNGEIERKQVEEHLQAWNATRRELSRTLGWRRRSCPTLHIAVGFRRRGQTLLRLPTLQERTRLWLRIEREVIAPGALLVLPVLFRGRCRWMFGL